MASPVKARARFARIAPYYGGHRSRGTCLRRTVREDAFTRGAGATLFRDERSRQRVEHARIVGLHRRRRRIERGFDAAEAPLERAQRRAAIGEVVAERGECEP